MLEQATLNQAAQVLAGLRPGERADTALRAYFAARRYLRPGARRALSRAVFAYFRWLRWLEDRAAPQARIAQAVELQERFDANPAAIKSQALVARAVPDWIREELEVSPEHARQLQREPALWLRARPGTGAQLASQLGDCVPSALAPDALRYTGREDLFRTAAFHQGAFEIQDLASHLVGLACAPRPGETWWDACAGEGGKTLHLCDLMGNKGVVWATDRHERRLAVLRRRAARAQLFHLRAALWDGSARPPTGTRFDGILVDAPCSGVGTWQRNPQARWTTSPDDVRELAATQLALLNQVAGSLRPGGRLVYAVCTLTRSETTGVAAAFSAAHPELQPEPVGSPVAAAATPSPVADQGLTLWPHELEANGMFIAAWKRDQ